MKGRLKRCVLLSQDPQTAQEVPALCLARDPVRIRQTPKRPESGPKSFQQAHEGGGSTPQIYGHQDCFYLDDLLIAAQEEETLNAHLLIVKTFLRELGFTINEGNSVHRILRIRNRYFDDDSQTASKQTSQYYTEDNNSLCKNTGYSERGFSAVGYASGSRQGLASSKTALSKTSTADDIKATTKFPRLQCHSAPLRGISDGTQMVGGEPPTTAN